MQARRRATFETSLAPAGVVAALTDFSERRPEIWPNLDPGKFTVHELGTDWALVTEGSRRPDLWARERYDWSQPGRVSWRAEASNFCAPGSGVDVTVEPRPGGSRVTVDWQRRSASLAGLAIVLAFRLLGARLLTSMHKPVFDRLAAEEISPDLPGAGGARPR